MIYAGSRQALAGRHNYWSAGALNYNEQRPRDSTGSLSVRLQIFPRLVLKIPNKRLDKPYWKG